jgi:hypothetical protein
LASTQAGTQTSRSAAAEIPRRFADEAPASRVVSVAAAGPHPAK